MDLTKVVATARALELTHKEIRFMKDNQLQPESMLDINTINRPGTTQRQTANGGARKKNHTIELCRYCGDRVPHNGRCKACNATCNHCKKRGHFEKVCESKQKIVDSVDKSDNTSDEQYII